MLDSRNITQNQAFVFGPQTSIINSWIVCNARAESGSYFGGVTGALSATRYGHLSLFGLSIDGCGFGIQSFGPNVYVSGASTVELKNIDASGYLAALPGAGFHMENKASLDLHLATTITMISVSYDGGVQYRLGALEVKDSDLAAMPDGGQVVENFQGVIFRR